MSKYGDGDKAFDAFLDDVIAVYKKHGLAIGHEDGHGAFIVETFDESNMQWLLAAHDERSGR